MNKIPRPLGSTLLSMRFQESNREEDKDKLLKHLISLYTINGFTWLGKSTTIPELSNILKIPTSYIMDEVSNIGTNMGTLASPENLDNLVASLLTLSTTWAIQDRGIVSQQLQTLLESQGGKYKPFITGEVNKVLKVLLDSNKNILETYKTFFTTSTSTTNILNVIQGNKDNQDKDYLSPDDALSMIQSESKNNRDNQKQIPGTINALTELPSVADECFQEYGIGDLESVKENRTGTEALVSPEHEGLIAKKPKRKAIGLQSLDRDPLSRRGIEVEDVDELP